MNENTMETREDTKSIGGSIPAELYWDFKKIQAQRKESATQALENAVRLYVELDVVEEEEANE
jgi:hypothetical protein